MELHNDDQLLKTMLNNEAYYPRLVKEIKENGFPHELLMISYKFGKTSQTLRPKLVYQLIYILSRQQMQKEIPEDNSLGDIRGGTSEDRP